MSGAHKGQVLALKNRVIPADSFTAFLAHYDITANDVLSGIEPIGHKYCLEFNGTTYTRVDGPASLLKTGDDFTFMCWFKTSYAPSVHYGSVIFSAHNSTGGTNRWRVGIGINGAIYYGSPSDQAYGSGYNDGKWHHLTVITAGSGSSVLVYVDGIQVTGFTASQIAWTDTALMSMGQEWDGTAASDFYIGYLSDVRLYKSIVSVDNIKSIMNNLSPNLPGLIAHWKLNEGPSTVVYDSSPYGNDGTIFGESSFQPGRSVYTLRGDGYFGGGIAVDDATSNLILDLYFVNWSTYLSSVVTTTQGHLDPFGGLGATRIQTTGGTSTLKYYMDVSRGTAGTPISASVWVKNNSSVPLVISNQVTGLSGTITQDMGWVYLSSTGTANGSSNRQMRFQTQNTADNLDFFAFQPQMEEKSFPTSFVDGVRPAPNLQYNIPIDPNNFTLNFWAKVNGTSGVKPFYINMYPNGVIDGNNRVYFRPSGTTLVGGRVVGGAIYSPSDATITDVSNWHMYTMTSSGTTVKIYYDGKLIATSSNVNTLTGTSVLLDLVSSTDSGTTASVIFDELRMDTIARTDDEILSWFYSNSPFYPKGIYKTAY